MRRCPRNWRWACVIFVGFARNALRGRFSIRAAWALILAASLATAGWSQGGDAAHDKSIPTSKVERLNRAPVSKDILKVVGTPTCSFCRPVGL